MNDFFNRLRNTPPIPPEQERGEHVSPGEVIRNYHGRTPPPGSPVYAQNAVPKETAIVRRGEAIAHVRALEERVAQLESLNGKLEATVARLDDRCTLLDEERQRYRAQAEGYRAGLIELASDMGAVGLLTQRAQATADRVNAIIASEGPPDRHEDETEAHTSRASEALRVHQPEFVESISASETSMDPLPERARADPTTDGMENGSR